MKSKIFISSDFEKRFLIGIHSGSFSIDEVVACAILTIFYSSPNCSVEIVRARQTQKLEHTDVLINTFSKNYFQKHYKTAYSIWEDFGEKIVSKFIKDCNANFKCIADSIGQDILLIVENSDKNPFSCISRFMPLWNQLNNYEENFKKAFNVAYLILEQIILKAISNYKAKEDILCSIDSNDDCPNQESLFFHGTLEISNEKQPWVDTVLEYNLQHPEKPVNFVIYHNIYNSDWTAICVSISLEESSIPRIILPKQWLGTHGEQLADITGVDDAISCSEDGLSMQAKTKDGIRSLCLRAILLQDK